jgi:hypothetical protein
MKSYSELSGVMDTLQCGFLPDPLIVLDPVDESDEVSGFS